MNLKVISVCEKLLKKNNFCTFLFSETFLPQRPAQWRIGWPAHKTSWIEITPNYKTQNGMENQYVPIEK